MLILKCSVSTVWNIVHGKENTEKYTKVPHRRVESKFLGHYVVVLVSALLLTDSQMWTLVVETYTLSEQSKLSTQHCTLNKVCLTLHTESSMFDTAH